jgi:hypothetical protein
MRIFLEARQIDPRPLLEPVEREHNDEHGDYGGNKTKREGTFVHWLFCFGEQLRQLGDVCGDTRGFVECQPLQCRHRKRVLFSKAAGSGGASGVDYVVGDDDCLPSL